MALTGPEGEELSAGGHARPSHQEVMDRNGRALFGGAAGRRDTVDQMALASVEKALEAPPPSASFESSIADDIRQRVARHLIGAAKVMDEALQHGLQVQFNIGLGPTGKHIVGPIGIIKHL